MGGRKPRLITLYWLPWAVLLALYLAAVLLFLRMSGWFVFLGVLNE